MKTYTKGSKRKAKKAKQQPEPLARGKSAERPTPERIARGVWTKPTGMGKHEIPVTDLTADMVALLLHQQRITSGQEQAARTFQAARLAYLAELPEISGYKSCIAGDVPGFDDGDGDPVVIERYRDIERAVGLNGRRELLWVCDLGNKPRSIELLRWALDVISEIC